MAKKVKVIYFSKSSVCGPSSRYRIYQFLPHLQAAGIECSVKPLLAEWYFSLLEIQNPLFRVLGKVIYVGMRFLKRAWDLSTLGRPDLIVIEGQLFPYCPPWAEELLKWVGERLVFEYDDAIYLTRLHQRKIPALMQLSSDVVVGNNGLAKYAKQFASSVTVIPTVVDTSRFKPKAVDHASTPVERPQRINIVWIGLAYNFSYLELLVPVLRDLQQREGVRFLVISSRRPMFSGVEIEFKPWSFETEVSELQRCDIGVMPLPDTEWTRGKCGLKLLQYMALGLPAVASPVGVNREIVVDGHNGFLATTSEEWQSRLLALCRDPHLRDSIGRAARQTVEENYSLQIWGPRLAGYYHAMVDRSRTVSVEGPVVETLRRHPH